MLVLVMFNKNRSQQLDMSNNKPCQDAQANEVDELVAFIKERLLRMEEGNILDISISREGGHFKAQGFLRQNPTDTQSIVGNAISCSDVATGHTDLVDCKFVQGIQGEEVKAAVADRSRADDKNSSTLAVHRTDDEAEPSSESSREGDSAEKIEFVVHLSSDDEFEDTLFSQRQDNAYYLYDEQDL